MALIIKPIISLVCTSLCFVEKASLFLLILWFSWLGILFGFFFIVILFFISLAICSISLFDKMTDIVLVLIKIKHVSCGIKVDAVKLNMIDCLSIFDSSVPELSKHFGPELFL